MNDDESKYGLQEIRHVLECNQRMLARLLGVSQSLVARVEKGERELPPAAMPHYDNLLLAMGKVMRDQSKPESTPKTKKEARHLLTIMKKPRTRQLRDLTYQLEDMRYTYSQELLTGKRIQLLAEADTQSGKRNQKYFHQALRDTHELRLAACDLSKQFRLEIEIAALDAQLKKIEALLLTV